MNHSLELECAKKALSRAKAAHTVALELHRSDWSRKLQADLQSTVEQLEERVRQLRLLVRLGNQECRP